MANRNEEVDSLRIFFGYSGAHAARRCYALDFLTVHSYGTWPQKKKNFRFPHLLRFLDDILVVKFFHFEPSLFDPSAASSRIRALYGVREETALERISVWMCTRKWPVTSSAPPVNRVKTHQSLLASDSIEVTRRSIDSRLINANAIISCRRPAQTALGFIDGRRPKVVCLGCSRMCLIYSTGRLVFRLG